MTVYLGVDGGGTATRAVLLTASGSVLGRGQAGPSNYHNVGVKEAVRQIRKATEAAWKNGGKSIRPADAAFFGCAGVKSGADMTEMRAAVEGAGLAAAGAAEVKNDLYNALAGGLMGRPGVAVIAGTGSNCLARDQAGRFAMCGGWGWFLDDEGGALGLAAGALRGVARAADGRMKSTSLLPAALAYFGIMEPDELLARLYARAWAPDEIAGFAPVVVRHAEDGDPLAKRVLADGAKALAALVAGAVKGLEFSRGPDVVLLGGCVRSGAPYQPLVEVVIRTTVPNARIVAPKGSPLLGAALNVLSHAGIKPPPSMASADFSL